MKPLEGLLVLEFCQYMAGPSAGLRLADLGARVVKIERPKSGEGGRQIALKNLFLDGSSLVFHTVNRNKESYAANLKDPEDFEKVKNLIAHADVMTHNFRPGVMEKIGLDYNRVKTLNPRIIYATITGYGTEGPWAKKPGQDLLIQSVSGLTWLSGNEDDGPTPFGVAVADILCGTHLVQGILASLIHRGKTNEGAWVEVSLLESMIDLQFEVITTHLNDGKQVQVRAREGNAHAYLGAPYGVYKTKDGYLALAMGSLNKLGEILDFPELDNFGNVQAAFTQRNEIMDLLRDKLDDKTTKEWLDLLNPHDVWCSGVFTYAQLIDHEGYKVLGWDQRLKLSNGEEVHTSRCPIRLDGNRLFAKKPAPRVGQDTEAIMTEFNL